MTKHQAEKLARAQAQIVAIDWSGKPMLVRVVGVQDDELLYELVRPPQPLRLKALMEWHRI